jgi:hypothetical protein
MRRSHLALPLLALTACAVRQQTPQSWRFANRTLIPPGVSSPDLAQRAVRVKIPVRPNCLDSDVLVIRRRRSVIQVTVRREALLHQPRGWLAEWIDAAESRGCLTSAQGSLLAAAILESLPLPTGLALRLIRADGPPDYVDLVAGNRLQVVSPILHPGSTPAAEDSGPMKISGTDSHIQVEMNARPDLVGFETALYDIQPKPSGRGSMVVPVSAQVNIGGKVEARTAPAANLFQFPPEIGFYRLFYKADQSEIIALSPTRAGLPKDAEACDRPGGPTCFAIPRGVGVNPYMSIDVNGAAATVAIGATIRNLIAGARKRPEDVLPSLRITKTFNGRPIPIEFDRTRQDILDFVFTGDEQVRW